MHLFLFNLVDGDVVLYFRKDSVWKIADFSLPSEGTTKHIQSTKSSRGTTSYLASEILEERLGFNNKVDIWSVGCILYELAVGQKAFFDEVATQCYSRSGVSFVISLRGFH